MESVPVDLRPLACSDCGFESHWRHRWMSVESVVCCQVEVSATSWWLIQRSPTECDVSPCVVQKPQEWWGRGPRWAATSQRGRGGRIPMVATPQILMAMLHIRLLLHFLWYRSHSVIRCIWEDWWSRLPGNPDTGETPCYR